MHLTEIICDKHEVYMYVYTHIYDLKIINSRNGENPYYELSLAHNYTHIIESGSF